MNSSALLIQSLQNPALYKHKTDHFKLIETHISWVLLTGPYVYKIKKPLNLGFLDFSTLEKRHHYCLEELRLNARLAEDIYLEVVSINGTPSNPSLNGAGTCFEYAVKMRQFEPDNTFDQLLVQQQLSSTQVKQSAHIIASFHHKIACAAPDSHFGSAETLMQPVRENFSQIEHIKRIEHPATLQSLAVWCEQQYQSLQNVFQRRKQNAYIRECHGDLHLGNIALIDGQVTPFDGIEFNPALYWIDVISDIAFLVMDLQAQQRHDLAFQFLNTYLQDSGDYQGLQLLRFYLAYRAMVRAKVNAIRAGQSSSADEHQYAITQYQRYVQLASAYTRPIKPVIIIMHGVSGSGKSYLSEHIIQRYPFIRLRSDVERKRLQGLAAQQTSHSDINSDLYSQANTDITYQHLLKLTDDILDAAYSVIIDATFLQQQQRQLFLRHAQQRQLPFLIVSTQANKATLLQRITKRNGQTDNVSEASPSVLENQLDHQQALSDAEQALSIDIETDNNAHLNRLWARLDDHFAS